MTTFVLSADEAVIHSEHQLGGKAYNLAWLHRHGFEVPPFLVLSTPAGEAVLEHAALTSWIEQQLTSLHDHPEMISKTLADIRQHITAATLPASVDEPLREILNRSPFIEVSWFAVRSSVVGEDAKGASFAGQMDSFLFQRGFEAIATSYLQCLASAFSERAYRYRLEKGLPTFPIRIAVVVQAMIDGAVSGVLFTAHPVTGQRDQFLLSACYGVGEGIVSGVCNTDEFTLDIEGHEIHRQIVVKDRQVVFNRGSGSGTIEVDVTPARQQQPCLHANQLQSLAQLGRDISTLTRFPQDIEWTLKDEQFYVLQTRPITHLPPPQSPRGKQVVWDNSNIQESYCGVTTPLTFSFANRAYTQVYTETMRMMQVPEPVIRRMQPNLANMLGLIRGRVYYNINNWYAGLALGPSFGSNKQDMERMMGLQDPVDFIQNQVLTWPQKLAKLPMLIGLLLRFPVAFMRMDTLVAQFQAMFDREYRAINRGELHRLEMAQLMELAEHLRQHLLLRWHTPILNDFFVMMMNGRVHRQLAKAQVPNAEALQNHLLAGESDIESTEPTKFLLRLCDTIRQSPSLQALFTIHADDQLLAAVQVTDTAFHTRCLDYIECYGDRTIGELKLESVTLRQNPTFMFSIMRNFLKKPALTEANLGQREQEMRANAEREAFEQVARTQGSFGLRRFKTNIQRLRKAIKYRENMRMARTRLFGLFRDIYREVGAQMAFYGLLDDARDVFYLTVEELEAYYDGRAVQSTLKPLVEGRKAEYAQYEPMELPHHFVTQGMVYHHNTYQYEGQFNLKPQAHDGILKGIECYPGIVEAPIKLIFSPDDELDLDGQILCIIRTDPGWAPLFPSAGGILVERGSTLSHSAVVARELGIPAVVGIPGLTKTLEMGDRVRMDGAAGTVERLDHPSA